LLQIDKISPITLKYVPPDGFLAFKVYTNSVSAAALPKTPGVVEELTTVTTRYAP